MANIFADLPLPVLNGPGASVVTSGFGSPKTLTCVGDFEQATIAVEASVDGGVSWATVALFQTGGNEVKIVELAANRMRVNVSGRKASLPFAANVDVAAPTATPQFAAITLPAGNGAGPALNIGAFDPLVSVIAGGLFPGAAIQVQISEDNVDWAIFTQFSGQGGITTQLVTANFIRAFVTGRKGAVPFSGSLALGAVTTGGVAGIDVQDEGIPILNNPHDTMNFVGGGVAATDMAGVATITVPGIVVADEGAPIAGAPHFVHNFIGGGVVASDSGGGIANITVAGIVVQDEGVPTAGAPHTVHNFMGGGVVVSDGGGGVAIITVPSGGVNVFDEGAPVAGNPKTTLFFVGGGVAATDTGGATAQVSIPGVVIADEGAPLAGAPHFALNFLGAGVTAANAGGGVASVTIPGNVADTAIISFGNNSVAAAADTRFLDQWNSAAIANPTDITPIVAPRACTLRNLFVRHQAALGNGNSVVYTVMINGVATGITATLASGAIGQASDIVNTAAVAQGDRISLRAVKALALGNGALLVSATLELV